MTFYVTLCFLSGAAMLIALLNARHGKMQSTIAITAGALIVSFLIIFAGKLDLFHFGDTVTKMIVNIDFESFLLKGVLGFLLFAGGLGINLPSMRDQKWEIALLALAGTLISTFFIGYALYFICLLLGINLQLIYCLLFGALISPTDPIAVLAIVKNLQAPRRISMQIEGESLFNDGFGLIIFVTLFSIAFNGESPSAANVMELFFHEAVGGIIYGLALGMLFHYLISSTNDHMMELLLTLCVPTTGYVLAEIIHVSGPLAMVVSGIIIGNKTRHTGFSEESKVHLDHFWHILDEFLNGLIFLLIGLVMITFSFHSDDWILMALAPPLVLLGRYISIKLCFVCFNRYRNYNPMSIAILTWGGLRGGLALAMALSIPSGIMVTPESGIDVREILLVMTYTVAVFSIIIQGSTITNMIEKAKTLEEENDYL